MLPSARFIDFVCFLANTIEGHTFSINEQAKELNELFDQNSIHYALTRQVLADIYKAHQCQNLRQAIKPFNVLDILGQTRGQLLDKKGDIDQINLIDRMGELTVEYFQIRSPIKPSVKPKGARIIPYKGTTKYN